MRAAREAVEGGAAQPEEKARVQALLERVEAKELPAMTMLALLSDPLRGQVTRALAKPPPRLVAQAPDSAAFTFEDLGQFTDREVQVLLREVGQKDLVLALKGSSPELRERFLGNLSERVRTYLLEEMSFLGTVPAEVVFAVQTRIVAQALRLARKEQVQLPAA